MSWIDVDLFIAEVKKRPPLYNNILKEYNDRELKIKLWTEVCEIVILDWKNLSSDQQAMKVKDVQGRWKSLRTCFTRECGAQKQSTSTRIGKRRRKYMYFDKLLFLHNHVKERIAVDYTSTNMESSMPGEEICIAEEKITPEEKYVPEETVVPEERDVEEIHLMEEIHQPQEKYLEERNTPEDDSLAQNTIKRKVKKSVKLHKSYDGSIQQSSYEISAREEKEGDYELDEDKLFLMSLIPSFKRFNDDQKLVAKMEILKAIRRVKLSLHNNDPLSTSTRRNRNHHCGTGSSDTSND